MLKRICAISSTALVAVWLIIFLALSPQVEAHASLPVAKADRADARPLGSDCSQRGWPYFEPTCLRDAARPLGEVRSVRLITTDRLPAIDE